MIKIKVSVGWHKNKRNTPAYGNNLSIYNFTNSEDNIYNNKKYYINAEIEDPDYWFILENTRKNSSERVHVPQGNVYFLNSETRYEPSYFMRPSKENFLKQFSKVYSPNFINLKNVVNTPPFLMWRLRGDPFDDFHKNADVEFYKNYSPEKKFLISVYCTNKQITEIQKVRLDFVRKLKDILGDDLHWYGADKKTETKIDGIANYKYHLVLENQINNNFISEKFYDAFLGGSYPIYAGAPNAGEYFDSKSFKSINLNDFNGSIENILSCIRSNNYEKNISNIKNSKLITLNDFNLIKRIDNIVEADLLYKNTPKTQKIVYPKIYFENKSKLAKLIFAINIRVKRLYSYLESFYN